MIPPTSDEAEKGLLCLATCCADTPRVASAIECLRPVHFFAQAHRVIFRAVRAILDEGGMPDAVLVLGRTGDEYLDTLAALSDAVPRTDLAPQYAEEIRRLAAARGAIKLCQRIARDIEEDPREPAHIDALKRGAERLLREGATERSAEDVLAEVIEESRQHRSRKETHGVAGVPSGFQPLDDEMGGWQPGLHVIAGTASMGKSAFLTSCEVAAMAANRRIRFVSRDMSTGFILRRIASHLFGVPLRVYTTGEQTESQQDALERAMTRTLGMLTFDETAMTAHEIVRNAIAASESWDILMVDHLQALRGEGKRYDWLTDAAYALKRLGVREGKPVLALCQVPKPTEVKKNGTPPPPTLADLKGSGDIKDAALTVVFPYRPNAGPYGGNPDPRAQIILGKNQNGAGGTFEAEWNAQLAMYSCAVTQRKMDFEAGGEAWRSDCRH